ncbi:hypothetical protein FQR65_LT09724 [Abscondita terminalis]|nr:hypothetical protein FQR65_LT09724 [Abscondita terminalis]
MSYNHHNQDEAANQLPNYYSQNLNDDYPATNNSGIPLAYKDASLTAGPKGVTLLQDTDFLDEMSHFDRERIPERVVHAKGAGAFGYFEATHDISKYTAASVFIPGTVTNIAVRFSSVIGESGSADTVRDPRGFSIKFYTSDGIWDLVGNNTPIFFIRDAILFPSFIHSFKRNPETHLKDANMFWDFLSLRPESTHQTMFLFSDRGIPDGHRHMHGYGSNTFSFINKTGELHFCKFHYKTDQGIRNIPPKKAAIIAGKDPDYSIKDLYNSIANNQSPSWTMYVQIMTMEEALKRNEAFDVTKVWPHKEFPLLRVGKIVLNRNPSNYFAEIEQLGFNPANLVPGIGPSPDRMLQGRLFAYGDTQRYRLGTNYLQLPVNSPRNNVQNFSRDGQQAINNQGGAPNYHPNCFGGPNSSGRANLLTADISINGISGRYDTGNEDNYSQPKKFYKDVLNPEERQRLAENIAEHLKNANKQIQDRTISMFSKVDFEFGKNIRSYIDKQPT